MEKDLNLTIKGDEKDIIIRHGDAPRIYQKEPLIVEITGAITAPSAWLAIRKGDPQKGHVKYSRSKMVINYEENERDAYSPTINGKLMLNSDLLEFNINNGGAISPDAMSTFIKMRKHFFVDDKLHPELVTNLRNFTAKVQQEVSQSSNDRGAYSIAVNKIVDAGKIPLKFTLDMPVFVGFPAKKFEVEVCLSTRESNVQVWLESPELNDIINKERDKIIGLQLKPFLDAGFAVIELE